MLSGAVDDWLDGIPRRSSPSSQPRTLGGGAIAVDVHLTACRPARVPMALLTPVLSPADFDPTRSVIPVPGDDDYEPGSAPEPLICEEPRTRCTAATGPIVSVASCMSTRRPIIR